MNATFRYALTLGMTACLATQLAADEPRPAAVPARQADGARRHDQHLDQQFAACLILDNQNEVAVAKLAEQRTKSPEVKKFAQMMQKDHEHFISELEKFAGTQFQNRRAGSATTAAGETKDKDKEPVARNPTTTNTAQPRRPGEAAPTGAQHDQYLQIKREIADECAASAQRELSSKEGREFDACYIGMQLAAHQHMVDELKVLERHASSELQATLKKGRETAQNHLDRAKEIMKDIERGETRTTAK